MARPVVAVVRRALVLMEQERPDLCVAMASQLAGVHLAIEAEGCLRLQGQGRRLEEDLDGVEPDLLVRTDRETVRRLLDGKTTLTTALYEGTVEVRGTTDMCTRGFAAFEYFVGAMLRIDGAENLRREIGEAL